MTEQQAEYNIKQDNDGVQITVNAEGVIVKWQEDNSSSQSNHFVYPKKERIPDELKWQVWERDNFTCQHCGSRKNLTVDHIYPESKGGKATFKNCQTLCKTCNSRKGAR